ncbi:MAG: hypothetical protein U0793_15225 [Gemmataceae bacterium]
MAIVDIVTTRQANLYAELLGRLGRSDPALADPPMLYAVTLRARKLAKKRPLLDAWFFPLTVGQPLPTIPLWLSPELCIELPLDPSYQKPADCSASGDRVLHHSRRPKTKPESPAAAAPEVDILRTRGDSVEDN